MASGDYPMGASPQQVAMAIHAQGLWVKQDPGRAALQSLADYAQLPELMQVITLPNGKTGSTMAPSPVDAIHDAVVYTPAAKWILAYLALAGALWALGGLV